MERATCDPEFKVQLFRFVDVFPMLKTPEQIHAHVVDYLQPGGNTPGEISLALKAGGIFKGTLAATIASQIRGMAEKFIAGADASAAIPRLRELWDRNIAFSVDLLGEACVSDEEAAGYQKRYLDLIQQLPAEVKDWPANPLLESDHLGPIPRANVSIKISSLHAHAPRDRHGRLNPAHFWKRSHRSCTAPSRTMC